MTFQTQNPAVRVMKQAAAFVTIVAVGVSAILIGGVAAHSLLALATMSVVWTLRLLGVL